ncbi:cation-transporting P-type ATPase [Alteromonas sp. ASW11-19]|uniref:Cation-transporting P-type ATPase n=1 Tax=Alteromonas salexigens TaxID=2982530 RepID=A0ABT2VJZ9_9ALTE|nr:cation-transporting P-type ATPase [Alteromonas salexigens]MCU7553474.1 cation-transporting P-type ATPase [Alteromonas salexigens]
MTTQQARHEQTCEQVLSSLEVTPSTGLSATEVSARQAQYGPNRLEPAKQTTALMRFLLQFHQPLVYILLGACAVTLVLQEWVDSAVIFGVVIVNAIVGYVQEAKALNALNALQGSLSQHAQVLREGKKATIAAEDLVPGDIVLLTAGERVPADLRLLKSKDLKIDESALTGESLPVEKTTAPLSGDIGLGDRINMGYSSSLVTYGSGMGVVTSTGTHTEIGKISTLLNETETLDTPLTQRIKEFSHLLLYAVLALAAVTFIAGWLHGNPLVDSFMAAVALAVGAIPEGLPAAVTIMLAIGVSRMAKRHAIIRQLPAVETLGSTTVICSDKTGTLTKNEMTVTTLWCPGQQARVSGTGYAPIGKFTADGNSISVEDYAQLNELLIAGAACNDASLNAPEEPGGVWSIIGDPTEAALLASARKAGITEDTLPPRIDEIPFRSETKYMATLHHNEAGTCAYVKGSVEAVTARCTFPEHSTLTAEAVVAAAESLAREGLRVLAFGRKRLAQDKGELTTVDIDTGLTFVGLQGMIDPPRDEAIEAVAHCRAAGVEVKMITGDHAITASVIGQSLGITHADEKGVTHTGTQLDNYNEEELDHAALTGKIFARVSPENKLALVTSLQKQNQVVAMTGDGVNDAPALRRADVGVAMALTGTDVARDAADMMLTDDNFASVTAAVEEGRGVYDNLKKFMVWTLPTNGGEALVIMTAVLLGVALPLLPVHILWVNMTTAVCLGLMLAFEPKEQGIMARPPHAPNSPMLDGVLLVRILLVSCLLTLAAFGLYRYELMLGAAETAARTVAVTMFVVGEAFYLFNCRSLRVSVFKVGLFSNRWIWIGMATMLVLQLIFIYVPWMQSAFQTTGIGVMAWLRILAAGFALSLVVGLEKKWRQTQRRTAVSNPQPSPSEEMH